MGSGGRKKQQGSGGASPAKEKEKEVGGAGKEPAAREKGGRDAGKEPAKERPRRRGREQVRGEVKDPAREKEKHQQQEQPKGKEVEEEGNQKEKEKAKAAAERQFFKVFLHEQSKDRLIIPHMFHQYLKDKEQPCGPVSLKGPSGNKWGALLTSESKSLCFEQGWKEFVADNSIKQGHFLVFTYDGPSQFSVAVFSSSGIIDPAALRAKPIKVEDDEGVQGDMDEGGTSEVSIIPQQEGNGITRKRTRAMTDIAADANASKRHTSVTKKDDKKRPEDGPSKDVSKIVNRKKGHAFSLLDESMTSNKTVIRDKNVPRSGKFVLKRSRVPIVISQRRPVTEEEKERALKRAKEFKSKNPFAVQIMMESYVYVGFFMNIPCEFVRESLPQTNKKMTLWDPLGKPWEVNYVYYSDRSVGSFSGGWGKFALGNNLEKFDVCVFELFKEDNIRVHIYRVVPEITPLLRASSKD